MQSDCIFCKIAAEEIPSYKIYENDYVYAFLDMKPLHLWHTLVIPKKHEDHFYELDHTNYSELMDVVKILSPAIQEATWSARIGIVIEWLEVNHVHVHLVPINEPWDLDSHNRHIENELNMKKIQSKILGHI